MSIGRCKGSTEGKGKHNFWMYVNFTFYLKVKLKKLGSGKFLELVWMGFMGWKGILVEGETNIIIYKV